jgi:phospholipid/cholesterol/gamma-HCH transport system substrate-binding protein
VLRRTSTAVALVLLVAVVGGCDLRTLGAKTGSMKLTAEFDDAQHLVPGHAVKVSDVQIGTITGVELDSYRAKVTMSIVSDRKIPVGTTATLSQTSLLGESYVRLDFPATFDTTNGPFLASGSSIAQTTVEASLEEVTEQALGVLGAIDGGSLAAIVHSLSTGLGGRGPELHALVEQLAGTGQVFAEQSAALGQAADSIGRLGATLASEPDRYGTLVADLDSATAVLAKQRQKFVTTLGALSTLASTLNDKVLDPHGAELRQILVQLSDVAATLAAERGTVGDLLSNLAVLAQRAPHAVDNSGAILIYGWITSIALPGDTVIPLAVSGKDAVVAMLTPPGAAS